MTFCCRLCHKSDELVELIILENFPESAQQMPASSELAADKPISLSILQCLFCGVIQTKNKPVTYYKDVITTASYTDVSKQQTISEIKALINKHHMQVSTALEIGSASGSYLEILRELGFEAEGIEHNIKNVKISQEKGLDVHQGYLLDGFKLEKKFHFIAVNNFLEHQPDISNFLLHLRALTDASGLVYISVPNLDRIIEKHCLYEFVTDHLVYFTKSTLQTALLKTGFEVLEVYTKNNDNDIVAVARKPQTVNLRNSIDHVDRIIASLRPYVEELVNKNKKVCVWGAGHRALALMALAKLDSISAVIDSAPFKQGRFTPILHKEIISPERFIEEGFDAVLIMLPGAYSTQAKDYLDKHSFEGEILIFEDQEINL